MAGSHRERVFLIGSTGRTRAMDHRRWAEETESTRDFQTPRTTQPKHASAVSSSTVHSVLRRAFEAGRFEQIVSRPGRGVLKGLKKPQERRIDDAEAYRSIPVVSVRLSFPAWPIASARSGAVAGEDVRDRRSHESLTLQRDA
jgi:hypothetical protein